MIRSAFITFFDIKKIESELGTASVTPRGESLIIREYEESKGKYKINTSLKGKINIGFASAEIKREVLSNPIS